MNCSTLTALVLLPFLSLAVRPGNYPLPAEQSSVYSFPIAHDFDEVQEWIERIAEERATQSAVVPVTQSHSGSSSSTTAAAESAIKADVASGKFNTF